MASLIKSLIGFDRKTATPEEAEAYRIANEALHSRVQHIVRSSAVSYRDLRPTTDRYGRSLQ